LALRQRRDRGLARTPLQHRRTAVAMHVVRGIAGLQGEPVGERRRQPGHLARLAPHPLSRQTVLCEEEALTNRVSRGTVWTVQDPYPRADVFRLRDKAVLRILQRLAEIGDGPWRIADQPRRSAALVIKRGE
jgi:hypothetical protein